MAGTDGAPVKSILVAVDGSAPSRAAGRFAVQMAKRLGARLHIMNVIDPGLVARAAAGEAGAWTEALPSLQVSAKGIVGLTVRDAVAAGVSYAVEIVQGFDVATGIVKEAEAVQADLVVVGSHGRTGVARVLIGSVAERVVRTSPCPVLVYRTGEPKPAPPAEVRPPLTLKPPAKRAAGPA